MYDRILVPIDGSDSASAALEHAGALAGGTGATVHVLHVSDSNGDESDSSGEDLVAESRERLDAAGVTAIGDVRAGTGDTEQTILEYADEEGIDAVVMGTRGREGLERLVLGSVTIGVVREAEVPVVVVPAETDVAGEYPYRTVVIATDGSEAATIATKRGLEVAKHHHASAHVLSVADVPPEDLAENDRDDSRITRLEERARSAVEEGAAIAEETGVEEVHTAVRFGSTQEEIHAYAEEHGADLLVVGTTGRSGIGRLLVGSVAEDVLRNASVPVMAVRSSDGDE